MHGMPKQSDLEHAFLTRWGQLAPDSPAPVFGHHFAPPRRYHVDFSWPDRKVAVELQGGVWTRGRHTRGAGYEQDCAKLNLLQTLGWRVFYVTSSMLARDPAGIVAMVEAAIRNCPPQ